MNSRSSLAAMLYFLLTFEMSAFAQGSLTPPGAPAPTMKTLDQIEPRTPISEIPTTITQPGSYYLTKNLTGIIGRNGIQVAVDDVAIDLNGFTINGVPGSLSGIIFTGGRENIAVRNGKIRSWGQWGIDAVDSTNTQFSDLQILRNGIGFRARANALVERCQAYGNNEIGFSVTEGSKFESCVSQKNANRGFYLGDGSIISNCTATGNAFEGIIAESGCILQSCIVRKNGIAEMRNGISTGPNSSVKDCIAEFNTGHGFSIGEGGSVDNSTARNNGQYGIALSNGGKVTHSTASRNGLSGFYLNDGGTAIGCTANRNTGDGITMASCCLVLNNNVMMAGYETADGAGIRTIVAGYANRIEGNTVTNSDRGIQVTTGGNIIIKNSASSNGDNYGSIASGNTVGPIVTSANIGSSTNPHANYQY